MSTVRASMAPAAFGRERRARRRRRRRRRRRGASPQRSFAPLPTLLSILVPLGRGVDDAPPRWTRWTSPPPRRMRATIATERRRRANARARIAKGDRAAIVAFVALVAPDDEIFPRRRTTTNGDGRGRGAREGHGLDVNPRSVRCDPRCWTARAAVDKNRGGSRRGGACWRVSERRGADLTGHPQALSPDPNGFRALFARGALCQSQVMTNPRSTQRIYRDREFCAVQMPRSPNAKSSHIFSLIFLSHLVQLRRFDWPKPLGSKNRGENEPDDCADGVRAPERSALRKRP